MRSRLAAAGLRDIADKLEARERLSLEDGVRLFAAPDLHAVGWLANRERERRHGALTYYNFNLRLEATNVCVASCLFCSFSRLKPGDPDSYLLSLEQVFDKLRKRAGQPLTEIHVVNGLHPDLPFSYYLDLLRGLKAIRPGIHLKCFTAVEIAFFSETYGMTDEAVLRALMEAGLDSLPGGGAEIFAARVRRKICHDKAFWIATGVEVAQMALWYGADDLDGTVQEEKIYHMAGSRTPEILTTSRIRQLIRIAGRLPVERDTLYNVITPPEAYDTSSAPQYARR